MNIFLINLDKDRDRLDRMRELLGALSIPYERIPAVYGTAMPTWLKPYFLDENDRILSNLLPGEVGCYASHLLVMKRVIESGQPALILEDDIDVSKEFHTILDSMGSFPRDWDIVRLSNPYKRGFVSQVQLNSHFQVVKFTHVSPSTGAYLITPSGAEKFLSWKKLRTLPVDQDLRRVWDSGLITYGIHPRPITPDVVGGSSIDQIASRRKKRRRRTTDLRDELARIAYDLRWLGVRAWALNLFYSGKLGSRSEDSSVKHPSSEH